MIPLFKVRMAEEAIRNAETVLRSGYIGEGPWVKRFELLLSEFLNSPYVLGTNSGTSALHLALQATVTENGPFTLTDDRDAHLGIQSRRDHWPWVPGGDVITTPLTCMATNMPLAMAGLTVKWADVDVSTLNINLNDVERKITPHTRFILVVHWGGYPVDVVRLHQICADAEREWGYRPLVIQDCAHAMGSMLHGRPLAAYGDISYYSFQAIKHLTCGDGGALVVNYRELYDIAKRVRWYGIDRDQPRDDFRCEQDVSELGTKWHMNDIAAAIGVGNFSLLEDTLRRQRSNADFYYEKLGPSDGFIPLPRKPGFDSAYWLFTGYAYHRDDFIRAMADRGIQVSRVHERNDKHTVFEQFKTSLPMLDIAIKDMICIPVGWWVTHEDRQHIVDSIKKGW